MKNALWLLLLLILVIVPSQVSADFFFATARTDIDVCSCASVEQDLILKNNDLPGIFTFDLSGGAADWAQITPSSVALGTGEKATPVLSLSVPCDARGVKDLYVTAEMNGVAQRLVFNVIAGKCATVFLATRETEMTECNGRELDYSLILRNKAQFDDSFVISMDKFVDAATLSANPVGIAAGQEKTVRLNMTFPPEKFGVGNFTVFATSEETGEKVGLPLSFVLEPCYDFDVRLEPPSPLCSWATSYIPLQIQNKDQLANNFDVMLEGPPWMSLVNSSIELEASRKGYLLIEATPPRNLTGKVNITIHLKSSLGALTRQINETLNVESCYDPQISFSEASGSFCSGPIELPVEISNLGEDREDFDLAVTHYSWVRVPAEILRLNEGEKLPVLLDIDVPSMDKTFNITAELSLKGHPEVAVADTYMLTSISDWECYKAVVLTNVSNTINYSYHAFEIPIENEGYRDAIYDVVFDAGDWVTLEPRIMFLEPGQKSSLKLVMDPSRDVPQGKYAITFKLVPRGTEAVYDKSFVVKLTEPLDTLKLLKISMLGLTLLLIALIFMLALSIRRKKDRKKRSMSIQWIFLILFFALLVVFIVFAYGTLFRGPAELNEINMTGFNESLRNTFLYQEISSGEKLVINLSQHFYDPDGDKLTYLVTVDPQFINYTLDGDILTLQSTPNFSGGAYMTIIARDVQDAEVVSPEIMIKVNPKSTFGIIESTEYVYQGLKSWAQNNPNALIFIIIVLVVVIIFLNISGKSKKTVVVRKKKK